MPAITTATRKRTTMVASTYMYQKAATMTAQKTSKQQRWLQITSRDHACNNKSFGFVIICILLHKLSSNTFIYLAYECLAEIRPGGMRGAIELICLTSQCTWATPCLEQMSLLTARSGWDAHILPRWAHTLSLRDSYGLSSSRRRTKKMLGSGMDGFPTEHCVRLVEGSSAHRVRPEVGDHDSDIVHANGCCPRRLGPTSMPPVRITVCNGSRARTEKAR